VFIKAYGSIAEARRSISAWLCFYKDERPHQALDYRTPSQVFSQAKTCGHMDNARDVAQMHTAETAEASHINFMEEKARKGLLS
jgi:hypothetical protein